MANQGALSQLPKPLTIKECGELLDLSPVTIRRYIKAGKVLAEWQPSKYGDQYMITHIPPELVPKSSPNETPNPYQDLAIGDLLSKIEALNRELGAWQGRYFELQEQVKLLAAGRQPWWKRIFRK